MSKIRLLASPSHTTATGSSIHPLLEMQRCISEEQLAELTGQSVDTLSRLRKSGQGPKFVQIGQRKIGYRIVDVVSWLDAGGVKAE